MCWYKHDDQSTFCQFSVVVDRCPSVDFYEKPKFLNVDQMATDITNCLLNFHNTITFKVLYVSAFFKIMHADKYRNQGV